MNRGPLRVASALAGATALAISFSAHAAEGQGWYAGGNIGFTFPPNQQLTTQGFSIQNDWNVGFLGAIEGGYEFANGLRPEIEFSYRDSGLNSVGETSSITSTASASNVNGHESSNALMLNLWYDLRQPDGFLATIHPYGGVGVGMVSVDINGESFSNYGGAGSIQGLNIANGSSTVFGYQLGFGAGIDLLPELVASVDFRYLMSTNFSVTNESSVGGASFSGSYHVPSFAVGLRYRFGAHE